MRLILNFLEDCVLVRDIESIERLPPQVYACFSFDPGIYATPVFMLGSLLKLVLKYFYSTLLILCPYMYVYIENSAPR